MAQNRYYDTTHEEAYYHIIARTTADRCDGTHYQLTDEMKTYLVKLLKRFDLFYEIDVLNYCIMSTHIHLCLRRRKKALEAVTHLETAQRHQVFLNKERRLDARSLECKRVRERMNSISDFMGRFLQESSFVINHQYGTWHGHLWSERFKSILLEDGEALSTCLKYIELNPVRAKMVTNPSAYHWSSWGEKAPLIEENNNVSGPHPYKQRIIASLRHIYDISVQQMTDRKIWAIYTRDLTILSEITQGTAENILNALGEKVYKTLLMSNPRLTHCTRLRLKESRRVT